MTQQVAISQEDSGAVMNRTQVKVFRDLTGKDLTDAEFQFALSFSQASGLNPLLHQVYFIKRGGKLGVQIGIDGYRLIAQRSGEYEGEAAPEWCGPDGVWREVWLGEKPPAAARVGVYRRGFRDAVYGIAAYSEFRDKNNALWNSQPANLLAKCAEAQALRKAFGNEIAAAVSDSEMEVEYTDVERTPAPAREPFATPESVKDVTPGQPDYNGFWMAATELGFRPPQVKEFVNGEDVSQMSQEELDRLLADLKRTKQQAV